MGIAPYKYFTYDGESSRDYDVYLTGTGVFNAPERAVQMVEIPGRNGNYALDQGKFNNISVNYKAGIIDYSESDFADKVSAVRNWLCSKVGYKRLSDDYNPNEYRMAVFKSGVNIEHEDLRTGTFEITFECKPQRWLTSGETATAVANNGTLSNPTLFESEPLLAVKGYGDIHFNGYTVSIENEVIGHLLLANSATYSSNSKDLIFNKTSYETSDTITLDAGTIEWSVSTKSGYYQWGYPSSVTDSATGFASSGHSAGKTKMYLVTNKPTITFSAGTNKTVTNTATATFPVGTSYATRSDITATCTQTITYTANYSTTQSKISITYSLSFSESGKCDYSFYSAASKTGDVTVESTQSLLGNPTYIDCDLGEAYKITSGEYVSLNSKISLGSNLPKLASGTNKFTYNNTVTELKVTPRWWKV